MTALAEWTPGPGYAKIIDLMKQQAEQAERDRNTPAAVAIPPADDDADDQDNPT